MKQSTIPNLALAGCVIGLLAGCASTKVTNRERLVYDQLPKPNQILVYDFAASAADVPADSTLALGTEEALRRLDRRPGHARARALLRETRWDVAGSPWSWT